LCFSFIGFWPFFETTNDLIWPFSIFLTWQPLSSPSSFQGRNLLLLLLSQTKPKLTNNKITSSRSRVPGVDFTIVLRATFTRSDPKCLKRQSSHQCLFALLRPTQVKAACKILMKLTLVVYRQMRGSGVFILILKIINIK